MPSLGIIQNKLLIRHDYNFIFHVIIGDKVKVKIERVPFWVSSTVTIRWDR